MSDGGLCFGLRCCPTRTTETVRREALASRLEALIELTIEYPFSPSRLSRYFRKRIADEEAAALAAEKAKKKVVDKTVSSVILAIIRWWF